MTLTCECDYDWYPEPGDWCYDGPSDYTSIREHAPLRKRRVRCCSCKELIDLDVVAIAFPRWRVPDGIYEESRFGEEGEIPIATWYQCERCADLYFSLEELGYCGQPSADQRELVKEYAELQKAGLTDGR